MTFPQFKIALFKPYFFNESLTISVSDYICNRFSSRKSDANDNKEHQANNSNNHVVIKQFNQEHITLNRLTVKDVKFHLLRCQTFNRDCCVNLLLIDLSKMTDICVGNLYNDNDNPPNIPKHDFRNLLNIATKESFLIFNKKCYKQVDGVAMGVSIESSLS